MQVTFVVLLALLAGCAYAPKEHIARDANALNEAVEESTNRMFVLNVLRAADRRPMHFTSVSGFRGSLTNAFSTGELSTNFGPGDPPGTKYGVAPSATFSASPGYDIAVLDTQEFYQGILSPVSLESARYFIDQGCPTRCSCSCSFER
jgi:hypothetical protein